MTRFVQIAKVTLLVAMLAALGSCTWVASVFNHMDVNDERYALDKMTVAYLGTDGSAHEHLVFLMSESLSFDLTNGFTGTGEVLVLDLVSAGSDLAEGDYNYSSSLATETLWDAAALTQASFTNGAVTDYDMDAVVDGGAVAIREAAGDTFVFQFEFDGYDADNTSSSVEISGRYRGEIDSELDATTASPSVVESVKSLM